MIYDCHAHMISADPERYPIAPLSGSLDRPLDDPVTGERLLADMDRLGIARAVAVQRAHVYGYDNRYVCDMADTYPDRFVAVCCVNALDAGVGDQARHWLDERHAVGLRLTEPYKGANMDWFAGAAARALWQVAEQLRSTVCLHMYRWNRLDTLALLPEIASTYPNVTIVLDHASNLAAEQGAPGHGVDAALSALARHPNVVQKVTTINFGKLRVQKVPLAPFVRRLVDVFGQERMMWGSDVSQSPGTYDELLAMGEESASLLSPTERDAYLHGTCRRIYWGQR